MRRLGVKMSRYDVCIAQGNPATLMPLRVAAPGPADFPQLCDPCGMWSMVPSWVAALGRSEATQTSSVSSVAALG